MTVTTMNMWYVNHSTWMKVVVACNVSGCANQAPLWSGLQLEDLEVTVADHIQKVLKPNFGAAWEEVGDEFEKEETFALASVRTLDGT